MILFFYILLALGLALTILNIVLVIVNRRLEFPYTLLMLFVMLALIAYMLYSNSKGIALGIFVVNPFTEFFALILTAGVLLVNLLGYERTSHYSNFALLSSIALIGMYLVAFANSLVSIFIGLEMVSMPTIFSILLSKRVAIESSVKLFVLSAVSIALFSFGMVLVYGATGTILLSNNTGVGYLMLLAMAMIIAAVGFEASLFPFNLWIPDVYQGATTYVTALLGGVNKKVGFLALIEVLLILFIPYKSQFTMVMYVLAVLTMFFGNLAALAQKNVKRLMAYSSIAQAGYIAIGLAVSTTYSIEAMLFQITAHMLMFIGAMAVILFMESKNRHEINDYIGMNKENAMLAGCFAIMLISLIGTPFTMGFIGKFLLFSSAVYNGMVGLALIAIVNSLISVYYYLRIVSVMYTNKVGVEYLKVHWNVMATVVICTFLIILFGVYPNTLIDLTRMASSYII